MSEQAIGIRARLIRGSAIISLGLGPIGLTACSSGTDSPSATEVTEKEIGAGFRLVPVDEAQQISRDETVSVIDVRTPDEYAEGHLDNAKLIDFYEPDFKERLGSLDPNGRYLVYCRSGNRSGRTIEMMKQLGFLNVADMDGGIVAWTGKGKPLTKG